METWSEVARKHLRKRSVLSTDGARVYAAVDVGSKAKVTVNHSRTNGGPYFTKKCTIRRGRAVQKVVAGTQALDSIWGHIKRKLRGVNVKNGVALSRASREAQWCHWVGTEDRFAAMGNVLQWLRRFGH